MTDEIKHKDRMIRDRMPRKIATGSVIIEKASESVLLTDRSASEERKEEGKRYQNEYLDTARKIVLSGISKKITKIRKKNEYRRKAKSYEERIPFWAVASVLLLFVMITGTAGWIYALPSLTAQTDNEAEWIGAGIFNWPLTVNGRITSGFGIRNDPFTGTEKMHYGTDIAAAFGSPVIAAASGTVTAANIDDEHSGGYGIYVMLDHGDDTVTVYGHCSAVFVSIGQTVTRGEVIAAVGSTGNSTGNHLHFEIRINGIRQDPMSFYQFIPGNGDQISDTEENTVSAYAEAML